MGRVSLGGGASTDDTCTSSIGESANVRSAVSHVHSPRRSRTRVATSPTRQRSASQLECFRVLGVARTASLQEIRVAYRSLCRKWHPDVNKDAGAAAMFMDVNRAYEAAVHAHERASKPKPQRPARRKDDFDEFWDDFLGGKPSTPKADPRRKRQGMKPGTNGGGERMRDPLAWSPQPRVVLPPPPYLRAADVAAERAAFESRVDRAVRTLEEGRRAQAEGRWADALALYTEVQEQYPDLALSVYGKAGRALMEYEVSDMRTAVTRLRVLSVEFKGYPEVHAALAAALYVEGGAAAAERQFTIATLLDSRFSNLAWLESERHWPPTLLLHMKRFLLLQ
ncbi:unnamed protein product [Closterium sp. NIES-65]|nr:unnamed protein product [Closterium sp. NIES-65]